MVANKLHKKLIFISFLVAIFTPSFALAAWYDPSSWFKKSSPSNQKIPPQTPNHNQQIPVKPSTVVKHAPKLNPKKVIVQQGPVNLTNAEIIKKVKPAVVFIETTDGSTYGSGSGMIISADGYILTNAHVVHGFDNADITLYNEKVFYGTVIGRDENIDVALIKINPSTKLTKIDFGDSEKVNQGDNVFTLGFPFGIKGDVSFKNGTISRRLTDGSSTYFETSAEIHPGNSGGPLVDTYGQVIGINSASIGKSIYGVQIGETIKLAIPINTAIELIPNLKLGINNIVDKASNNQKSIIPNANNLFCNGKYWSDCSDGKKFICPSNGGDPSCISPTMYSELKNKYFLFTQSVSSIYAQYNQEVSVLIDSIKMSSSDKATAISQLSTSVRNLAQLSDQVRRVEVFEPLGEIQGYKNDYLSAIKNLVSAERDLQSYDESIGNGDYYNAVFYFNKYKDEADQSLNDQKDSGNFLNSIYKKAAVYSLY